MSYRIALVGGGSGGHVFPLVAVAQELQRQTQEAGLELELQVWGDGVFIKKAAQDLGVPYKNIQSAKWRRYFSVYNFLDLLKIPVGFLQSVFYAWAFMPDIVFAKGGYTSVIPAFVARFFRIPIVIHESDAVPGKANVLIGKLARKVFISFESSRSYFQNDKTYTVGNPVRQDIGNTTKEEALKFFQLSSEKPVVLVVGGSQGAQKINNAVIEAAVELVKDFQVIHQTGDINFESVRIQIEKLTKEGEKSLTQYGQILKDSYKIYPFFDYNQIKLAYAASDVVVTRAGAGFLFEISSLGKPAIVIPISTSASNHQLANAREFANYGGILIEEPNLIRHILIDQIKEAYKNREELGKKIIQFAKPNSARRIAEEILAVV